MTEPTTPARVAHNEAAFREANERIEIAADAIGLLDEIPLVCECGRAHCTEVTRLPRSAYERVRRRGTTFWVVPGHEITQVDGMPVARIVEELPTFTILEKVGEPGAIAQRLDPRTTLQAGEC